MILNNYSNLFNAAAKSFKNYNGTTVSVNPSDDTDSTFKVLCGSEAGSPDINWDSDVPAGIVFIDVGWGTDPVTPNDYILPYGNKVRNLLTVTGYGKNDHISRELFNIYVNFANNTAGATTIRDIGVYGNIKGQGNNPVCLLMRKVLDNPVTIEPGESYSFTYRLRIKDD